MPPPNSTRRYKRAPHHVFASLHHGRYARTLLPVRKHCGGWMAGDGRAPAPPPPRLGEFALARSEDVQGLLAKTFRVRVKVPCQ